MLFVISGQFKSGSEAKRLELHERYNEHLRQPGAPVRYGGPLYNAAGERSGVLLVIEAKSLAIAEAFLGESPYAIANLYEVTVVSEFRPEIGSLI